MLLLQALPFSVMLVVGVIFQGVSAYSQGKPIRESQAILDTATPPSTAVDLARYSDAVVVATYLGQKRVVDRTFNSPMETYYTLRIDEVIKDDPRLDPRVIEIGLPGGEKEHPSYIERISIYGADLPERNHRYLVFLKVNRTTDDLFLAYSSAGLYDVTSGRVLATKHNRTLDNAKSAPALIAELRRATAR